MVPSWLSADGRRLLGARALRSFAYGYLAVILSLYLDALGLGPTEIGLVLTAAIAGSALMTVFWSLVADRVGRRRTVGIMALLMALGGAIFASGDGIAWLVVGAFTGTISATSSEVGVFQTVEQAVIPQTAPDRWRTWVFAVYNTLAYFAAALGSLAAASVGFFGSRGLAGADAYRPLFWLYALIGLANLVIYAGLSDRVEQARLEGRRRFIGIHRSTGIVARLSMLFAVDAFAGALVVQSLIAYWLFLRWGLDVAQLSAIFFAVGILSGLSLLAAGWLAQRFGLLNTMVFSHLPSNVLLMLVPLAPAAWLAVAVLLLRTCLSQMDVPTRQSYVMAIVAPDERTATAGITNVARAVASAAAPAITGMAFSVAALGLPFFLAGGMKIAYDTLIYRTFHDVHPPEEIERRRRRSAGSPTEPD